MASQLIADLGEQLGLPDMVLDDAGSTSLSIDGGAVTVAIAHDVESGGFDLQSALAGVQPTAARLARALAANFCWGPADGAIFGLERTTGRLVLQRRCPGEGLDVAGLTSALERLVDDSLAWTKLLGEIKGEDPPEPAAAPGSMAMPGMRA